MSATPAFADNGPHVATSGNMTVDRCAGCHRAHTATDAYLLMQSATSLCESCHGASGTGAANDVVDGVGYTDTSRGTVAGALRGGGFSYALIASTTGVNKTSVGVLTNATKQQTTSSHNIGATGPGTAWGGSGGTLGTSMALECTSCHDPHGNGNWRILKPVGDSGTALTYPAAAAVSTVTITGSSVSGSNTTYYYDITTAAANTFKVTNPVTYIGSAGTILAGNVLAVSGNTVSTSSRVATSAGAPVASGSTGGTLGYADPQGIASATSDGTNYTYTTWNLHGMVVGQKVTVAGMTPTGFNVTGATITAVTTNTITVVGTGTVLANGTTSTKGGTISGGIPDSLGAKVYTTGNYWQVDDHSYTGSTLTGFLSNTATAAANGPTAVIANISQWCATCHTKLLAGSGSYKTPTGDATFMYMHRSNAGKENSPNCLQCHVAHGSNASASGAYSSQVTNPDGSAGDSFLLRVDNRGTCNMCHNK